MALDNFSATAPSYDSINEQYNQPAQNPNYQRSANCSEISVPPNELYQLLPNIPNESSNVIGSNSYCGLKGKSGIILALALVVILAIAAGVTTFYLMVAFGNLEQYGRKCTPGDPMSCVTTDLTCLDNGICGCKSSDYKWDQQQRLCVALVNSNAECRKWGWDGSLAIPCTENAICNDEHRCECLHYFAAIGHECIASFDAICSSSKECNQLEFLFCGNKGKCECRPGTVRHQKANKFGCYVEIGETCAGNMRDLCIDANSKCAKGQICRCNEDKGYIPSKENTGCGKIANETCAIDDDCADTLSCLKTTDQLGVCFCLDTELFDDDEQKCHIKAGQQCRAKDMKQCVENSVCKRSTCVCKPGWGLDEESGLCLGTHGTVCSSDKNCLGSRYFHCINGKCGCDKNHTHFNESTGSCFGNVTDTVCVSDLNCDQRRMVCDQEKKTCKCTRGFEEDNKSCYGLHGTLCAETSDCLRSQYSTCLEGSCGCNSAFEQWEDDQCELQFQQRCRAPGNRINMKCVGNLTCLIDPTHTSDVFKLCGCDSKYVLSEDKRLCINSAISVHSTATAVFFMLLITKFLY